MPVNQPHSRPERFIPTNLATCYEGERTYYKDLPSGRCFTTKDCTVEIDQNGKLIKTPQL